MTRIFLPLTISAHLQIVFLVSVILSGCALTKLRPLAADHATIARTVYLWCMDESGASPYGEAPCSPELIEDLEAIAEQAAIIQAYSEGRDPLKP